MDKFEPHKSSLGPQANMIAVIGYIAAGLLTFIPYLGLVAFVVPLLFFFLEKSSDFVRRHAVQALSIGASYAIASAVLSLGAGFANVILTPMQWYSHTLGAWVGEVVVTIVGLVLWALRLCAAVVSVLGMIRANNYEMYEVPLVGRWFDRWLFKDTPK